MSGNQAWRKSLQSYHEDAIILVRKCVSTLRSGGDSTESALSRLAPALRSSARRMRTLFYHDGTPVVMGQEWIELRRNAANFFFERAAYHRAMATQCETEADALQNEQLEFSWDTTWHGNVGLRGRTAAGHR